MWIKSSLDFGSFEFNSDINLYLKIESRGFLIEHEGELFQCVKSLKLDGVKRIKKR